MALPTSPTPADRLAEFHRRQDLERAAEERRAAFIAATGARPIKWSGYNLSRLLRLTGERPERVEAARRILFSIGMGNGGCRRWPTRGGVFDHGEMWARAGKPWAIVGHPYGINAAEREALAELARLFPTLRVAIDDRPSYYGWGTNHVRIELTEVRRPFVKLPATSKTRAASRAARKAFAELAGGAR